MKNDFYKIIDFPSFQNKTGTLFFYQKGENQVSFDVKKTLVIMGMKGEDERGGHTHHKTNQILICVAGSCVVKLDNGKQKTSVTLDSANKGLLLYPYVWHTMGDFAPGTILLVLADREYDEKEYIRNYDDFIQQLPKTL